MWNREHNLLTFKAHSELSQKLLFVYIRWGDLKPELIPQRTFRTWR